MDYIIIFAEQHWFLTFVLIYCGYLLLIAALKFVLWYLPNRLLRTINVCVRGWPPAHLDADGDWKPEPKAQQAADKGSV